MAVKFQLKIGKLKVRDKPTDRLQLPILSNSMYITWFIRYVKVYLISKYRVIGNKKVKHMYTDIHTDVHRHVIVRK